MRLLRPALCLVAAGCLLVSCKQPQPAPPVERPIIALYTDYGTVDPYVAQIKGAILNVNPRVNLVDLSHDATPFDIARAAYLFNQSAQDFPTGTIFVAVVDPGVGSSRLPILLKTAQGRYYIGPDNGIFSLVVQREGLEKAWKLDKSEFHRKEGVSSTFHGRDIFGPVAAHLADGVDPATLGTEITRSSLQTVTLKEPAATGQSVTAEVWHIDHFGNIITNVPQNFSPLLQEGILVRVNLAGQNFSAPLVKTYNDIPKGKLGLLFGSTGLLEICTNQGSAASLLKAVVGAPIVLRP